MPKRLTKEEFIKKAKNIHGEKYDYSLVEYKNNATKVKLICKKHGIFEIRPNGHLDSKQGCRDCQYENNGIRGRKTTDWFIEKAKNIHGEKYDYSLVEYKNKRNKIKIICSIHGEFEQKAESHLNGKGCLKCVIVKSEVKK